MSIIITKKEKQLAPEGMHLAHLIRVIDIGTQEGKFGKAKKAILSWELSEAKAVFKEENGEEPFVLSNTYNQSLDKKSNLVRDLAPWIGSGFVKSASLDLGSLLLGKACLLNVIHETKENGETYAKIISIAPVPKRMAVPDQILPSLEYSVEDGFNEVFEELPVWIREKIKASDEIAGERPSEAEITERNVRQATANARQESHRTVGINESTSGDDDLDSQLENEVNVQAQLAEADSDEPEW
jgi:hypothetical protein